MAKDKDILVDNKFIYNFEYYLIRFFGVMNYVVVTLFIIGIFQSKPVAFVQASFVVKFLMSLFLIYRFNDWRKNKIVFTELDRAAACSAGFFILITSVLDLFNAYIENIRAHFQKVIAPVLDPMKQQLGIVSTNTQS